MGLDPEAHTLHLSVSERERVQGLVVKAHQGTLGRREEAELRGLMAKECHNDYLLTVPQETLVRMGIWLIDVWGLRKLTQPEGSVAGSG